MRPSRCLPAHLDTFSKENAHPERHWHSGESHISSRYHILYIRDLYIMTSIESIAVPVRLFSIFNISPRALDVLFIALSGGSAILRDSIRRSYWDACGPRQPVLLPGEVFPVQTDFGANVTTDQGPMLTAFRICLDFARCVKWNYSEEILKFISSVIRKITVHDQLFPSHPI